MSLCVPAMDLEDFDSGWDEPPSSSLDSENLNNFEPNDAMNGYEQSELQQQMLEMRDDPAMSSYHVPNTVGNSTPQNKDGVSVDCTSLSSEIFLATRLLHDETIDSTTLTSFAEPESSPYNDNQNFNNYLDSHLENDAQQDTVDSIGLPQQEALDSEFLYSNFEQLSSERRDESFDEDFSNKSWTDSLPPSNIMPTPVLTLSRNSIEERKLKGERKKRILKIIKKRTLSTDGLERTNKFEKAVSFIKTEVSSVDIPNYTCYNNNSTELKLGRGARPLVSAAEKQLNFNSIPLEPNIPESFTDYADNCDDFMTPSTSSGIVSAITAPSTTAAIVLTKDGRKVPSYLRMYKMKDDKYPNIFACINCYGIFTTLDSAMFHPCLKKRRGRRPKILADCLVPL
ncbi:uncharacterized protein isoform X2 [Rhodnius prolixus]|uniref:uncharacterized protein isoform X2 n=1 Tax=Rhodnius prolixus TaxID=13249 RepID=UPI003D18B9D5